MPNFEQPIIIPQGTVFDQYRELTPREEATLESAEATPAKRADTRLSGTTREQLDRARTIFGKDFLGPEAVETTWGVRLEARDIPPIPFSPEDLARAKDLGQQLVLRVNKAPDGTPLTMQKMNEIIEPKLTQGNQGKLLYNVDWYAGEEFYTTDTPELQWALVSNGVLPDSTGKNYLQQTELLAAYLRDQVFKGMTIPREYADALREFDAKKAAIAPLVESTVDAEWQAAAKQLSELAINQLTRPSPVEALHDVPTNLLVNNERPLSGAYTWTNRRSSDGWLVDVGRADTGGARVDAGRPGSVHSDLGVSFSRSR